eukprot:TRINITY_DN14538_c0_g1_i2.p1 TRINITY_DN14538_c0_g1~~TRINITY_DN14538_c0_g1_i2.p1  ORF type:complete len:323 (-),score=34.25 TRINITY_DN14538_c0_g1_i2:163-1131(-)
MLPFFGDHRNRVPRAAQSQGGPSMQPRAGSDISREEDEMRAKPSSLLDHVALGAYGDSSLNQGQRSQSPHREPDLNDPFGAQRLQAPSAQAMLERARQPFAARPEPRMQPMEGPTVYLQEQQQRQQLQSRLDAEADYNKQYPALGNPSTPGRMNSLVETAPSLETLAGTSYNGEPGGLAASPMPQDNPLTGESALEQEPLHAQGFPYRIGTMRSWYLNHLAGPVFLQYLEFKEEFQQGCYIPWRNTEDGGWCTDDTLTEFKVLEGHGLDTDTPPKADEDRDKKGPSGSQQGSAPTAIQQPVQQPGSGVSTVSQAELSQRPRI